LRATTVTQSEGDIVDALRCWLSFVSSDFNQWQQNKILRFQH